MRFEIGDERRAFAASIDKLTASADMPAPVRSWARGEHHDGMELVQRLGEMGVTGLLVDTAVGGVGGDTVDVVVALERLGYACVPGPLVDTVAVAPGLLGTGDRAAALAAGTALASVASPSHMPRAVDAEQCDTVLYLGDDHAALAEVVASHPSVDPARTLCDVVEGERLDVSAAQVRTARDLGALGTAAYLLGAGLRLLDTTVEYATLRTQFGKPIGSFQSVAHMLADTKIALDLAHPLVLGAALAMDTGSAASARDVSAARVACAAAANRAARSALQVHGALGYTAEYDVSLYLTRIRALGSAWGTVSWHRGRIADALITERAS
jgi:alkylation response protein AidB-like acyl-CoA dehydrogenase